MIDEWCDLDDPNEEDPDCEDLHGNYTSSQTNPSSEVLF